MKRTEPKQTLSLPIAPYLAASYKPNPMGSQKPPYRWSDTHNLRIDLKRSLGVFLLGLFISLPNAPSMITEESTNEKRAILGNINCAQRASKSSAVTAPCRFSFIQISKNSPCAFRNKKADAAQTRIKKKICRHIQKLVARRAKNSKQVCKRILFKSRNATCGY